MKKNCGCDIKEDGWIGCSESYSGSGRPSRIFAWEVRAGGCRPDCRDNPAYPFNGMGGCVHDGVYPTEAAALNAVRALTVEDSEGWVYWAQHSVPVPEDRLYPGPCPRCGEELAACSPSGRGSASCDHCQVVYGED